MLRLKGSVLFLVTGHVAKYFVESIERKFYKNLDWILMHVAVFHSAECVFILLPVLI